MTSIIERLPKALFGTILDQLNQITGSFHLANTADIPFLNDYLVRFSLVSKTIYSAMNSIEVQTELLNSISKKYQITHLEASALIDLKPYQALFKKQIRGSSLDLDYNFTKKIESMLGESEHIVQGYDTTKQGFFLLIKDHSYRIITPFGSKTDIHVDKNKRLNSLAKLINEFSCNFLAYKSTDVNFEIKDEDSILFYDFLQDKVVEKKIKDLSLNIKEPGFYFFESDKKYTLYEFCPTNMLNVSKAESFENHVDIQKMFMLRNKVFNRLDPKNALPKLKDEKKSKPKRVTKQFDIKRSKYQDLILKDWKLVKLDEYPAFIHIHSEESYYFFKKNIPEESFLQCVHQFFLFIKDDLVNGDIVYRAESNQIVFGIKKQKAKEIINRLNLSFDKKYDEL